MFDYYSCKEHSRVEHLNLVVDRDVCGELPIRNSNFWDVVAGGRPLALRMHLKWGSFRKKEIFRMSWNVLFSNCLCLSSRNAMYKVTKTQPFWMIIFKHVKMHFHNQFFRMSYVMREQTFYASYFRRFRSKVLYFRGLVCQFLFSGTRFHKSKKCSTQKLLNFFQGDFEMKKVKNGP